jgi:hypothetical protein
VNAYQFTHHHSTLSPRVANFALAGCIFSIPDLDSPSRTAFGRHGMLRHSFIVARPARLGQHSIEPDLLTTESDGVISKASQWPDGRLDRLCQ